MNELAIKNSTAEFLIFTAAAGENSIEVRFEDKNLWMTQKMMSVLFDVTVATINEHLKHIWESSEISPEWTIRNFLTVASNGKAYDMKYYNLETIIAVGFRTNSTRAIQFRQRAMQVLKQFAIKWYVLDNERLKNGTFLGEEYFQDLLWEIREIRASERRFYQKITDIYATAVDYDSQSSLTKDFFATVQNKIHYAIHGNTAPELITKRAGSDKPCMWLKTWKKAPLGKIAKSDVVVAKNYLELEEIKKLDRFITMYLDYAEDQAESKIPMTMQDWKEKLDIFLKFNNKDLLDNPGKVSAEIAKSFAESEFAKYRITQDRLFESDFDKMIKSLE